MATLPTDRDTSDSAADHATDHNTVHGLWNKLTTKGDLLTATGAQAYSRLAVGTNGHVLTADSAEATGIKWAAQSGSSVPAWSSFTPTWTGFTVGNGTVTAAYVTDGKNVFFRVDVVLGSTSSVASSNAVRFTLPTASKSGVKQPVSLYILDVGTRNYLGICLVGDDWGAADNTKATLVHTESGNGGNVDNASPMTWASGDKFSITGVYEAA